MSCARLLGIQMECAEHTSGNVELETDSAFKTPDIDIILSLLISTGAGVFGCIPRKRDASSFLRTAGVCNLGACILMDLTATRSGKGTRPPKP